MNVQWPLQSKILLTEFDKTLFFLPKKAFCFVFCAKGGIFARF